jgi:hypothetical protein
VAWLPELGALVTPFGPVESVTIRRMLSHESGLPAEPPGTDWAVPAYQGAPDRFGIADGSSVAGGGVTFRRSADGRVVSAFFLDTTWVRLTPVSA